MNPRGRFWTGFSLGVLAAVLAMAVAAGVVVWVAKKGLEERLEEREREVTRRTRPLLRPPELPEVGVASGHGRISYDWSLETLEGEPVPAARFRDRVLLIDFWATWCAPCVAELPGLARLQEDLREEERIALLLVTDEDAGVVGEFVEDHEFEALPIFLVREGVPSAIHPSGRPSAFVVDCSGRVVYRHSGGAEWDGPEVRDFLRSYVERTC